MPRPQRKDDFLTFVGIGDERALPSSTERDLAAELYRKSYQGTVIDQYEKSLGITPRKKKENRRFKTKVFSPDYDKDQALLSELMNSPQFRIELWKDTWTQEGLFKIFILYSEDLDYQSSEDKLKNIAEGTDNE